MLSLSQSVSTRSASTIVIDDYRDIYCAVEHSDNILNLPTTNLNQFNSQNKFKKYRKRIYSSESENSFYKTPSIDNMIHPSLKTKKQNTKLHKPLHPPITISHKPLFPLINKKLPKKPLKPLMTKNNRGRSTSSNKPIDKIKRRRKKTLERKSNPITIQRTDTLNKLKTNIKISRSRNISNYNNQLRQPIMNTSMNMSDYHIVDDDNNYCYNDTILY
eukprot:135696_1